MDKISLFSCVAAVVEIFPVQWETVLKENNVAVYLASTLML